MQPGYGDLACASARRGPDPRTSRRCRVPVRDAIMGAIDEPLCGCMTPCHAWSCTWDSPRPEPPLCRCGVFVTGGGCRSMVSGIPRFVRTQRPGDGGAHVGNGLPLLRYLRPESAKRPDGPERALRQVRAELARNDATTVLYSNEWLFGQHRSEQLRALRDALAVTGVTLQTVVYLRDIAGLALSAYAQQVETRLVATTFSEYVGSSVVTAPKFRISWQARLERMLEVVGPEHVLVQHYDSNRHRLVESLLEVLGITDSPDGPGDAARCTTGRSHVREIEWKRYLNARITTRAESRRLGEAIAQLPAPSDGERLGATAADVAALRRFENQVDWVNRTFFEGDPGSLHPRRTHLRSRAATTPPPLSIGTSAARPPVG